MDRNNSLGISSKLIRGRLLANRYQLIELIGSGAMGQVYRAEDKLLGGVTVAVKLLSQSLLSNRTRQRFEQEATISALLGQRNIHIVGVRDYGVDENNIPFYVMEYLQGESLSDIIRFHPLGLSRFLTLMRQICFGLESAHKGTVFQGEVCSVIHRDIKPSNIFVVQDSAFGELVKILDFGVAKIVLSGESNTQAFMGTLAYCSPEQIDGKKLDNRSDIYSVGIVMYELLTGEMPIMPENTSFSGWYEAHHHFLPEPFSPSLNLPPELAKLILQCLEKDPDLRPQSVEELIKLIDKLQKKNQKNISKSTTSLQLAETLPATSPKTKNPNKFPSLEALGKQSCWPDDKPRQRIVFPRILEANEGAFASLWIMLDQKDILAYSMSNRYNQFIYMPNPHPMLLWLSVLYTRGQDPRWLPCYLDLKTPLGQQLTRLLAQRGRYWLLSFAMQHPQKCQKMTSLTIASEQRSMLVGWADTSQGLVGSKPQITKKLLRQELKKIKPEIITKLHRRLK